jgi:hypothetical protein
VLWLLACSNDPRIPLDRPLACAPGCERRERARVAVSRAVDWLAARAEQPDLPDSLDLLIATTAIDRRFRSPRLDALRAALAKVDRPGDPRRRAFDPTARLPEDPSAGWTASPGASLEPNLLLVEALYCPEYGMRPASIRWLCDDLRDDGGPRSGHATWYLTLAVDAGCVPRASTCLDPLVDELRSHALAEPAPVETVARDRLAEQVLFSLLAGADPAPLAPAVDKLLAAQRADGAFADDAADQRPFAPIHATLVGGWALAEWAAR